MSVSVSPGKLGVYLSDEDRSMAPRTAGTVHGEASRAPLTPAGLVQSGQGPDYTGLALGAAAIALFYFIVMKG
jgi:hypothetical protein